MVLSNGERVELFLDRVTARDGTAIWLVAADTVLEVPRMHDSVGLPEFEKRLPAFLTEARFGTLPLWVPLAMIAMLLVLYPISRLVLAAVAGAVRAVARLRHRAAGGIFGEAWATWSRPSAFLLTLLLHHGVAPAMGVPLLYRLYYDRAISVLVVCGVVWLLWRLTDGLFQRLRTRLFAMGTTSLPSGLEPGRRLLKGIVLVLGGLGALGILGVNLSTTLAGLGLTSLVIAFAAQKTLENVFGGFSVLADRTIVVGEFCRIGTQVGEVEEVGLRSTRLRTIDRTVLLVPNGALATMTLENLSRRDKYLFNHTLGLRHGTSASQLEQIMANIRLRLEKDARIDREVVRVRLVRITASALEIEINAHVKVLDYDLFLAIQEEHLLAIMRIVEEAGSSLALPSQANYLRGDSEGPEGRAVRIPDP